MKTREVIHITCEIIILTIVGLYLHKRIKKLSDTVEELKKENEELRRDLNDIKKILSVIIVPHGNIPLQKNTQERQRVVFHPLSTIEEEEEDECDDDKCNLGVAELQEEGKSMLENSDKDSATIIIHTYCPPPSNENDMAKLEEVIETTLDPSFDSSLSSSSSPISLLSSSSSSLLSSSFQFII